MAGGLGTRMKSATPKHLHPLLGRRMVDWVIEAARDAGVEPRRRRRLARHATARSTAIEVAVQRAPLGTGDAVRAARGALAEHEGDVLVLNGDVPALTPAADRAPSSRRTARGRRRHRPLLRAGRRPRLRPHRARRQLAARAHRRGGRRVARRARAPRGQLRHLRLPEPRSSGRCSSVSNRTTRRASSMSPTASAARRRGRGVAVHRAPVAWEVEGINTRVELAPSPPRCATGSTRRTCSPASRSSTRRRPGSRPASSSSRTSRSIRSP